MSYKRSNLSSPKIKILLKTTIRKELQKLLSQITHECASEKFEEPEPEDSYNSSEDEQLRVEPVATSTISAEMKRSLEFEEEQNRHNEDKRIKSDTVTQPSTSVSSTPTAPEVPIRENSVELSQTDIIKKKLKSLRNYKVVSRELVGHSDIVWCVSLDNEYVISGSRDTTARVWDVRTGEEVCSLRGHTDSINGVSLLPKSKGDELLNQQDDNFVTARKIGITASSDCSLRIWLLPQGILLKSIYTFNNIMCLDLISELLYAITGTDGGKIEMWDLSTGQAVQSVIAYENSVSSIEVSGLQVCSGSVDGIVKIWLLRDNILTVIYTLDPSMDITNPRNSLKHLKSLCTSDGNVFMGDEDVNLKILSWKKGKIFQIKNHLSKYGCTDAVSRFKELLVSSSYNLDSGAGCVHLRLLPEGEYVCSLPEIFSRILCLGITDGDEVCDYRIVTGGFQLSIWDIIDPSQKTAIKRLREEDCKVCNASYRTGMTDEATISSSEDEASDEEESLEDSTLEESAPKMTVAMKENSLWNWCNIL